MIWGILIGATISLFIYAIVFTGSEEKTLQERIKLMKDDFDQMEKGYILILRIKDEEISRLRGLLKNGSDTENS